MISILRSLLLLTIADLLHICNPHPSRSRMVPRLPQKVEFEAYLAGGTIPQIGGTILQIPQIGFVTV